MSNFLNFVNIIWPNEIFQSVFKIFLIAILSGFIGYEREHSGKPAGFRTYVLVGVSSVLVMLCGVAIANMYGNNDPSRMPAQLLSGIGFIGAGTILSNGFKVKGLTTATAILSVTCIGLTVGAGLYLYAVLATAVVYVVLRYSHFLNGLDKANEVKFKIITENPRDIMEIVNRIIQDNDMEIKKVAVNDGKEGKDGFIMYQCKVADSSFEKAEFMAEIIKISKVKQVQEI